MLRTILLRNKLKHLGLLLLLFFLSISFYIRRNDFKVFTGIRNLEASHHVLLTIRAYRESPVKNHWYLPSVSLGGILDKNIPWGATLASKTGDYIYTSFTSVGFVVPHVVFSLFKIDPSIQSLATFNFIIGAATSIILFFFLISILEHYGYNPRACIGGALSGIVISIFSKEALHSHGLVYWCQSLYQLILVSSLFFLFNYLIANTSSEKKKYSNLLAISVFLGAWTEWTGYVFGTGIAVLLFSLTRPEIGFKKLPIKLIFSLMMAGTLTMLHFSVVLGFKNTYETLVKRFFARSTSTGSLSELLHSYISSFGLFMVILMGLLCLGFFSKPEEKISERKKRTVSVLFAASCLPLIENIIMLQHAQTFSFDRLKFIFPAALVIGMAFGAMRSIGRVFLASALLFCSLQAYKDYQNELKTNEKWAIADRINTDLLGQISRHTDLKCSVLLSNTYVRGYTNLLFQRGVYELKTADQSMILMKSTKACSSVYLEGEWRYSGLPIYTKAIITRPDGTQSEFSSKGSSWPL